MEVTVYRQSGNDTMSYVLSDMYAFGLSGQVTTFDDQSDTMKIEMNLSKLLSGVSFNLQDSATLVQQMEQHITAVLSLEQ